MTTVSDIYNNLCELAPIESQLDFDNAGFLVGRSDREVKKVLLSLDITDEVISEAEMLGAELIVSHHPLIFTPLRALTDSSYGSKALKMAEKNIAAICMHTNLDIAKGGVNDILLSLMGAEGTDCLDEDGCGRIGEFDSDIAFKDFLIQCKAALNAKGLRYYDAGKPVKRIAVMGGSGGDSIDAAFNKGCDTYLTADIKYHQFLSAQELGINLIDGDHFYTENPVIPVLADRLSSAFPQVEFIVSKLHHAIIDFV